MENINNNLLTDVEITEIMNLLNSYRLEYEVSPLTYSSDLSCISHDVAKNLLKTHIRKHKYISSIDNNLSRNITFSRYVRNKKMINIKNIISKWYNENKYYDFENENNTKYKHCINFINLVCEDHITCGIGYNYSNGKCTLCIHFGE